MKVRTMRQVEDSKFKLVKAIVEASQSERELKQAIRILEVERTRALILDALKAMLTRDQTQVSTDSVESMTVPRKKASLARRLNLSGLLGNLKARKMTAPHLHELVKRRFQKDIPVNKEGLERYLGRLSRMPFFDELASYLFSSGSKKTMDSKEDPWVREMLSEQKKKSNEKK